MMGFYRALLHLYPRSFRREYESELCRVFAERMRGHTGPLSSVVGVLIALRDVVPNAIAAHMEILTRDLRVAGRTVRHAPGFAVTTILVVALGVGANTAAFSLADFVFLRPLPYYESERLVKLWQRTPDYGQMELSPANYRDWKTSAKSFTDFAAYTFRAANLVYGCYDLTLTPSVRRWGARNLVLSTPIIEWFTDHFVPDRARRADPDVSPLYADLRGLPPAHFTVGTEDPLLDDTLFLHARWLAAGNAASLFVAPGGMHGFDAFPHELAKRARRAAARFVAGVLETP